MNNRILSILKYLLGWPFSILAFIFILKLIIPKTQNISTNLIHLKTEFLLLGIGSFLLFYFLRSYIWHKLVKIYSDKLTYKQSAFFWATSELKRYIPGNIWAFMGRAVIFSEFKITKKEIGKLLLMEAEVFVAGAGIVSLISLPFIFSQIIPNLNYFSVIAAPVFLIVLFCSIFSLNKLFNLPNLSISKNLHLLLLSICALLFFGLGNYFTIFSIVNLPINLVFQLCGFFVLSLLLGYLSILTPAGFGVREGIIISGLSHLLTVTESAFVALFSRLVLIISELIFVLLTYWIYKLRNEKILKLYKWIATNKHLAILFFLISVYIFYFSYASYARHDNFYTGRFDLGNMAQTVWNTAQGRIFEFSNPNGTTDISRLAFHADFLLILLAPFYAIFPDPKTLLFIQTAVVAVGGVFVYLLARDKLKNKNLALVLSFAYLINPSIQRANLYDFHAVTLATTFLLGMYYFYEKKNYIYFSILALLAAISKEQIWMIVAFFGVLLFFKHKKRAFGASLFFVSLAIFYYLVSVAIPNSAGSSHFALSYYSEYGDGPISIIKTIISSPQKIIFTVLQKERIDYLIQLFIPLGFLSVFSPPYLIFAGPDLLINLLSNNSQLHQIYYQYTAAISPFIFISAIYAVGFLLKKFKVQYVSLFIISYILFTSIYSSYRYGPLPGSQSANLDMFIKQVGDRDFINKYLETIPNDLSIASSNNVGAHLAERQKVYTLPLGIDQADVVIFLLNDSEPPDSLTIEKQQVKKLKEDKLYTVDIEKGTFIVFKKKGIK